MASRPRGDSLIARNAEFVASCRTEGCDGADVVLAVVLLVALSYVRGHLPILSMLQRLGSEALAGLENRREQDTRQ